GRSRQACPATGPRRWQPGPSRSRARQACGRRRQAPWRGQAGRPVPERPRQAVVFRPQAERPSGKAGEGAAAVRADRATWRQGRVRVSRACRTCANKESLVNRCLTDRELTGYYFTLLVERYVSDNTSSDTGRPDRAGPEKDKSRKVVG